MTDKNKNNYLWIGIAIVLVVTLAIVFISNQNNNPSNEVTCNSPYIKVGSSCCLDQNYNNVCDNDETSTQNQQTQQQEQTNTNTFTENPSLNMNDWTIISGWEDSISEEGNNRFRVKKNGFDALFITTIYNTGNIVLDDIVETTSCNWVTGDRTIMSKFQYHGFDCFEGCANIKTKSVNVFSTSINLGEKIRLEQEGNARLSFRFSVDASKGEVLVSEPTSIRCEVSVFSEGNSKAFDQSTVYIDFD